VSDLVTAALDARDTLRENPDADPNLRPLARLADTLSDIAELFATTLDHTAHQFRALLEAWDAYQGRQWSRDRIRRIHTEYHRRRR
jgi:hypothetical protein